MASEKELARALAVTSFDLQGAHHDLTHQFDPKDGGVCARTIQRAIKQIEATIAALIQSDTVGDK